MVWFKTVKVSRLQCFLIPFLSGNKLKVLKKKKKKNLKYISILNRRLYGFNKMANVFIKESKEVLHGWFFKKHYMQGIRDKEHELFSLAAVCEHELSQSHCDSNLGAAT